jgi:hypothetical protein
MSKSKEETIYGITPIHFSKEDPPLIHNSPYLSLGFKRIGDFGQSNTGKTYLQGTLIPMLADVDGWLIIYCGTLKCQKKYDDIMEHMRNKGTTVLAKQGAPDWDKLTNTLKFFNSKGKEVFPELDNKGNQLPWKPELDDEGKVIQEVPIAKSQGDLLKSFKHNLVIIDDQPYKVIHGDRILPWFQTSRHFHMSVVLINQRFVDVHKTARENMDLIILYKTLDGYKNLLKSIGDFFDSKEEFNMCMKYLSDSKFNYLILDFETPYKALRVRQKFGGLLMRYARALAASKALEKIH